MNIMELFDSVVLFIESSGIIGVLIACTLMFVESIIPILPLGVFITINFLVLGKLIGFIVSWILTVLGCIMSYYIFKKGFGNKFEMLTQNKKLLDKYTKLFKNISTGKLLLIIAMPFTPAFVVNIVAGLVQMDFKKYLTALIIGKIVMVYFWGFIGSSLVESIKNPIILVKVIVIMLIAYISYLVIKKVFKLEV